MPENTNAITTPLPEYTEHQERLELINARMGGTAETKGQT